MPQLLPTSQWPLDWSSSMGTFSAVGVGYLLLVRLLRWRRYNAVHRKYAGRLHNLMVVEAQEIVALSQNWDLPSVVRLAGGVAFMRTVAIPSTSQLLAKTEMRPHNINSTSRRLADTSILLGTWFNCPFQKASPDDPSSNAQLDPRAYLAIARVNWLHRKYDIRNDDYLLYAHSHFPQPYVHPPWDGEKLTWGFLQAWAKRYGWRPMSSLECQARFILWREIGILMGIKDIPETIEELQAWMEAFEGIHMVPAESNHQCAEATLVETTYEITSLFGLKTFVKNVLISMLDERTRTALMLPEPPRAARVFLEVVLRVAAFVQGHLLLPRRASITLVPWQMKAVASEPVPRQNPTWYSARPWYKPEPKGIFAIIQNAKAAFGLLDPDDIPGPKYKAEGYRLEELGPPRYENSGHAEVIREAGEMMGCPLGLDGGRIQAK